MPPLSAKSYYRSRDRTTNSTSAQIRPLMTEPGQHPARRFWEMAGFAAMRVRRLFLRAQRAATHCSLTPAIGAREISR
jgi:hypothetical protein